MDELLERTQLGRLVRQATQFARLRTMHPLVGYVGAAMRGWVSNGMVTSEQARKFDEALIAAGAELSLAPVADNRDFAGTAAKQAARAAERRPAPGRRNSSGADPGGAPGDAPQPRKTRRG